MKCPATERQAEHMAALKAMKSKDDRGAYIDNVRATDGNFYADWLSDEYTRWFWETKDKQCS